MHIKYLFIIIKTKIMKKKKKCTTVECYSDVNAATSMNGILRLMCEITTFNS